MQLPQLTPEQIEGRCTETSFNRGVEYFHGGTIGNPVLHGYSLSATCGGSNLEPYRVSVELMPTGIVDTYCSCPYAGEGDCKHIAALLLTCVHAPETIYSVETLLSTLAEKPTSSLLQVISEVLKRAPELAPVAQVYADIPETPLPPAHLALVTVYGGQIDRIFGRGFLESQQLHQVLKQLETLRRHGESLAKGGETEFALSLLHALIHQSTVRYPDTLQKSELPRFVAKCTKTFTQIAMDAEKPDSIREHCHALLSLSFDADKAFTPLLTSSLEQLCLGQEMSDLQATIGQRLDESPDR